MRTQGTKLTSDGIKSCVFEVSLAELQNDAVALRKFRKITEDVQGKKYQINFHGMQLTQNVLLGQKMADHD